MSEQDWEDVDDVIAKHEARIKELGEMVIQLADENIALHSRLNRLTGNGKLLRKQREAE